MSSGIGKTPTPKPLFGVKGNKAEKKATNKDDTQTTKHSFGKYKVTPADSEPHHALRSGKKNNRSIRTGFAIKAAAIGTAATATGAYAGIASYAALRPQLNQAPLGANRTEEWFAFSQMLRPFETLDSTGREKALLLLMQGRFQHIDAAHIEDYAAYCDLWVETAKSRDFIPEDADFKLLTIDTKGETSTEVAFVYQSSSQSGSDYHVLASYKTDSSDSLQEKIADETEGLIDTTAHKASDLNSDGVTTLQEHVEHNYEDSDGIVIRTVPYDPWISTESIDEGSWEIIDPPSLNQHDTVGRSLATNDIINLQTQHPESFDVTEAGNHDPEALNQHITLLDAKHYLGRFSPHLGRTITAEDLGLSTDHREALIGEHSEVFGRNIVHADLISPEHHSNVNNPISGSPRQAWTDSSQDSLNDDNDLNVNNATGAASDVDRYLDKCGFNPANLTDPLSIATDVTTAVVDAAFIAAKSAYKLRTIAKRREHITHAHTVQNSWQEKSTKSVHYSEFKELTEPVTTSGIPTTSDLALLKEVRSFHQQAIDTRAFTKLCANLRAFMASKPENENNRLFTTFDHFCTKMKKQGDKFFADSRNIKNMLAQLEQFGIHAEKRTKSGLLKVYISIDTNTLYKLLKTEKMLPLRGESVELVSEDELQDLVPLCFFEEELQEESALSPTRTAWEDPKKLQSVDDLKTVLSCQDSYIISPDKLSEILQAVHRLLKGNRISEKHRMNFESLAEFYRGITSDPDTYYENQKKLNELNELFEFIGIEIQFETDKLLGKLRPSAKPIKHKIHIDISRFHFILKSFGNLPSRNVIRSSLHRNKESIEALYQLRDYDQWKVYHYKSDRNLKIAAALISYIPLPADEILKAIASGKEYKYRRANKKTMNERIDDAISSTNNNGLSEDETNHIRHLLEDARHLKEGHMAIKKNVAIAKTVTQSVSAASEIPLRLLGPAGVLIKGASKLTAQGTALASGYAKRRVMDTRLKEKGNYVKAIQIYACYKKLYTEAKALSRSPDIGKKEKQQLRKKMDSICVLTEKTFGISPDAFKALVRTRIIEDEKFKLSFSKN